MRSALFVGIEVYEMVGAVGIGAVIFVEMQRYPLVGCALSPECVSRCLCALPGEPFFFANTIYQWIRRVQTSSSAFRALPSWGFWLLAVADVCVMKVILMDNSCNTADVFPAAYCQSKIVTWWWGLKQETVGKRGTGATAKGRVVLSNLYAAHEAE